MFQPVLPLLSWRQENWARPPDSSDAHLSGREALLADGLHHRRSPTPEKQARWL